MNVDISQWLMCLMSLFFRLMRCSLYKTKTRKMKRILCYIVLMVMTAGSASGQRVRGVEALFRAGYGYSPTLDRLKKDLIPAERNGFSDTYFLVGWEASFRLERAMIGIEGTAAIATENKGIMYSEPFMISAHYRAGYILSGNARRWIYPSIGTGPAFVMFSSYPEGNHIEKKNYNLLSPSLDLGLNADYVFPRLAGEGRNYDRLVVGFRAGYIYSFTKNHWRDDDWNRIEGMNVLNMFF